MYGMPLSASSGAAGSGEANMKGFLDIWDCSGSLHTAPSCWDVAYLSLLSLTHELREWPAVECVPLAEEFPSPPLTFLVQPILRNLGTFEIVQIYVIFLK